MKLLVFVIFLVFLNEPSCILADVDCQQCTNICADEVRLPIILLGAIGVVILILIMIVIYLGVLLYKHKQKGYTVFETPNTQAAGSYNKPDSNRKFITQTSQEMTVLSMGTTSGLARSINENKSTCSINTMMQSFSGGESNINRNEEQPSKPPQDHKVYKYQKKFPSNNHHNILLQHQMKKICDAALAKSQMSGVTASLKDLNKLLENENNMTYEVLTESANVKALSNPHLDIYDNPSSIPVPLSRDEMYEYLPPATSKHNNTIVVDNDTQYLLALSKDNLQEPAYINARCMNAKEF